MTIETKSTARSYGGTQGVYTHASTATGTPMTFAVYVPPHAEGARLPVVWYLSGLTCTHANVTDKGEYRRACAALGLILVAPDTSPRGDGVADDPAYDMGQGAGFYVDATQAPWAPHFRMWRYVTEELPALIAERLGLPHASFLDSVTIGTDGVRGQRAVEGGSVELFAPFPAVASVTERLPEARFPNFKGIMQAKKKPLQVLTLADLDAEIPVPSSIVVAAAQRPARNAGTKIVDEGNAAQQIAEFLVTNRLA